MLGSVHSATLTGLCLIPAAFQGWRCILLTPQLWSLRSCILPCSTRHGPPRDSSLVLFLWPHGASLQWVSVMILPYGLFLLNSKAFRDFPQNLDRGYHDPLPTQSVSAEPPPWDIAKAYNVCLQRGSTFLIWVPATMTGAAKGLFWNVVSRVPRISRYQMLRSLKYPLGHGLPHRYVNALGTSLPLSGK
jgi:hypothetical protein